MAAEAAGPAFMEQNPAFINNKRKFISFLEAVQEMVKDGKNRLIVDLDALKRFDFDLGTGLQRKPLDFIAPFQAALKSYVLSVAAGGVSNSSFFTVGIEGSFGKSKVSPRGLYANHLATLVCVEGIVTRCSLVRPKVHRTVHYCEATGEYREAQYHDATSMTGLPTGSVYPTKDDKGNPFTTEFGLSEYRDHQQITIQEMPERTPAGLLPCSVDVMLDDDLVDRCKPGDRVQVFGVYRALPNKGHGGSSSGVFRTVVIANHIRQIGKDHIIAGSRFTDPDIKEIKKLAKRSDIFELLAHSFAPSIYGHDHIKRALVLLLLGGVEHNLDNGTHIRGDINLLMVGDPSTAKSQFLRFVLNIAPLAINTTGRGASGVGLTAAVISDKDSGERRLEAGAMVLGDRGVVCIDEFDKMSAVDRVAIHEVMEQQTVTIAKAGIHMSLNARCSVVAAANPVYGQYDQRKKPMENVNLPDSLLSRFDLLFIVLDNVQPEIDRNISEHVLRNHRYKPPNSGHSESGAGADWDNKDNNDDMMIEREEEETPVFEKYNKLLHGRRKPGKKMELISLPFVKKYFEYAKAMCSPVLTEKAADLIAQAYSELRSQENKNDRTLPVTARSLETLIRLSTAHAKLRLGKFVEEDDVNVALDLMKFALNHDVGDEEQVKSESDDDDDDDKRPARSRARSSQEDAVSSPRASKPSRVPKSPSSPRTTSSAKGTTNTSSSSSSSSDHKDPFDIDVESPTRSSRGKTSREEDSTQDDNRQQARKRPLQTTSGSSPQKKIKSKEVTEDSPPIEVLPERLQLLQKTLVSTMSRRRSEELTITELESELSEQSGPRPFHRGEVDAILAQLEDDNKLMVREGVIHRI